MPFGEPNSLYVPAQLNFDQVRPHLSDAKDLSQLLQLEAWAHEYLRRLWPRFAERKDLGMIRECHGDLHLGNVVETEAHGIASSTVLSTGLNFAGSISSVKLHF